MLSNPDSPAEIRSLLEERGLTLKKRWGQHFLVNRGAREKLVSLLAPEPTDVVWEIGPGLGAMTGLILERVSELVVFEIDRGLCRYLEESFGGIPTFSLVPGDFLKTWKRSAELALPHRLLGNLPYRSASVMIAALVEGGLRLRRIVATVQKELGERMSSRPGSGSYSSFSVLCQAVYTVVSRGDLRPGSFYPAPEVISSIMEMRLRDDAPGSDTIEILSALSRGLFAHRRKTIRNNLGSGRLLPIISPETALFVLDAEGIDPGARAEELPPEAFLSLARAVQRSAASSGPGYPTGSSTP